jgi:hypothetical protein
MSFNKLSDPEGKEEVSVKAEERLRYFFWVVGTLRTICGSLFPIVYLYLASHGPSCSRDDEPPPQMMLYWLGLAQISFFPVWIFQFILSWKGLKSAQKDTVPRLISYLLFLFFDIGIVGSLGPILWQFIV